MDKKVTMKNYLLIILFIGILISCGKKEEKQLGLETTCGALDLNFFSLSQDKQLGAQLDTQIFATPNEYPVLDTNQYTVAYGHLRRITNEILNSGEVLYKDQFLWKTRIIRNDSVLNAFVTPGGYIYVFTGLIKYLDKEDDLAGVLGHEIGHADLRHSTYAMSQQYGSSLLLDIVLGKDRGQITQILEGLSGLKYSRCNESQADETSVIYLAPTDYNCAGAASFFEKINSEGGQRVPEFLSTHPNPGNRVESIKNKATSVGCNTVSQVSSTQYQEFKNSLP